MRNSADRRIRAAVGTRAGVALLAVLAAGGCAPARSGSLGPAPTAGAPTGASPPASTSVPGSPPATAPSAPGPGTATSGVQPHGTVTVQLWLTRDGRIVPTARTRPATPATSRLALAELVAGPTPVEAAARLGTGLPPGTTPDIVGISGGVETVRFPDAFYAGDPTAVRLRRAQVVYTLTQFPTVSRVAFLSGTGPRGGAEGRADYADLLPPIVVTGPVIGQSVGSPVVVTGTAEVFEATVNVRVLDAAGREVGAAFTLASCGTGCQGRYRVAVPYRLAAAQPGTVQVFEISPRDGSRINAVAVPVVLAVAGV